MQSPILTIAIPTYNRAGQLDNCLERLSADPDFDASKIEVLVSDNASTDDTRAVVAKYPSVRYHRNQTNIGFANFTVAMRLATGRYVRIMNDTASFRPSKLGLLLRKIESTDSSEANLLFCNPLTAKKRGIIEAVGSRQLIEAESYLITWVANFGMWKKDFEALTDPDRFVHTLMQHVDWQLCSADNGKKTVLVVDEFLDVQEIKKKGTYNLFDTFINKYLSILRFHGVKGRALRREKYRLFRHFVLPWRLKLKKDKEYQFDTGDAEKVIRHTYRWKPYYWLLTAYYMIKR